MISRKEKHRKQPMEFSKKILMVAWLSGSFVIAYALWLTYLMVIGGYDGDISLIQTILTGGFAEITAGTAFYYWKARKENEIKLTGSITKEDDII